MTHPLRGFVELATKGRSVGFPPLRGTRRARSLRSLGSNPLLSGEGGIGSPLRGSPSSRPAVARFEPLLSGEGGIRTPKPVRAPVFETGALPFCHLSGCRLPGCSRRLPKRPARAAGEGAPRGLLLSNFRDGRGGIGSLRSPNSRPRVARLASSRCAGLAELAPVGRSVRTHEGQASSTCLVGNCLYGRGGIGFLPLRGTRRARDLRSLGSNPRGRALSPLPRETA